MACNIDNCTSRHHAKGYCAKHYKRLKRTGKPEIKSIPNLKEVPGYLAIHVRLSKQKGKASNYQCFICNNQAHEWSYNKDDPNELTDRVSGIYVQYSINLDYYVPLCVSCHRKFDASR